MTRIIELKDAVGMKLSHDITEIRPGEFKGVAFKKGHTICDGDLCHLQKLGKRHLYVLSMKEDEIHEDDAARLLADALAGDGVTTDPEPKEGKINLYASHDGLLEIDVETLAAFNRIDDVMCATLHTHTRVVKGERIAATRAIPMVMDRKPIEKASELASGAGGIVHIRKLQSPRAGLIITGNEVYHGLIQDRFEPVFRQKIADLKGTIHETDFAPDEPDFIRRIVMKQVKAGCSLILVSGGMSVDPDDVTRAGIRLAGAKEMYYGSAVLPGAMFLVAYIGEVAILGVPACGMYHRTTVLDLILPRILAGEHITGKDIALLGHGGLCRDCEQCIYPHCSFGKGGI